jgi:CheY-like chemotaxis protein
MRRLESDSFDVILADVHMPGIGGMEFYRNATNIDPALSETFVFITGDSLDERLVEFFERENRPYLNKPFEIGELIKAIENISLAPRSQFPASRGAWAGSNV